MLLPMLGLVTYFYWSFMFIGESSSCLLGIHEFLCFERPSYTLVSRKFQCSCSMWTSDGEVWKRHFGLEVRKFSEGMQCNSMTMITHTE